MSSYLTLKGIYKSFGPIEALREVSFDVAKGSLTILTGADGAGKSTLFKVILNLLKAERGEILFQGLPLQDPEKLKRVSGYMPERFSLYPDLTVEENLNFAAEIRQVPRPLREKRKEELLKKTGMEPFKKRRAGRLSGGMKQKLALSSTLLSAPEFLLLDEPTTGVDPLSRAEFFKILEELRDEGKTILLSTPYLDEAERGERVLILKNGRLILDQELNVLKETFPYPLFRILTTESPFQILERWRDDREIGPAIYPRGKYLYYLQTGERPPEEIAPNRGVERCSPSLEDIYLYNERKSSDERLDYRS